MNREEIEKAKEILSDEYPAFKGFIKHTLVAEMAVRYASLLSNTNQAKEEKTLSFEQLQEAILNYKAKSEYKHASLVILRSIFLTPSKEEKEEECPCCDGKGVVEGEFCDDLYPCNTCFGSGEYYSPTHSKD